MKYHPNVRNSNLCFKESYFRALFQQNDQLMHNSYNELKHAKLKKDPVLTDLNLFISEIVIIKPNN